MGGDAEKVTSDGAAGTTVVKVKINGQEADEQLSAVSVDLDLNQPDMCLVKLRNENHHWSNATKIGHSVDVTIKDADGTDVDLFKGEVVGLEPQYNEQGQVVVVRAFNRLHRLLRGRKTKTYLKKDDQAIADEVAKAAGLKVKAGSSPKIKHEHVYQHNQTDLEFLRLRAARLGFEVWCEDTTLYFDAPKTDKDSKIELNMGAADAPTTGKNVKLKSFRPKMSTANLVNKVIVRGWDPEQKKEIVGEESVPGSSKLGKEIGAALAKKAFKEAESYAVDHPIFSVDEAKAIAKARLNERLMGFITGDGSCDGNPNLKPGIVVTIIINPKDKDKDVFNGKYLLNGTTHTYTTGQKGKKGGYETFFRVSRDASSSGASTEVPASEELE